MRIEQITRFPIKGFYGQNLKTAEVSPAGMAGDRRYGIFHPSRIKNRSPSGWSPKVNFLQMVFEAFLGAYETEFDAAGDVLTLKVAGRILGPFDLKEAEGRAALAAQIRALGDVEDEGLLEVVEGVDSSLTDRNVPCITLANPTSLADLEAKVGRVLGRARFRMNVWFSGQAAWAEHDLVGKTLRLGDRLEVEVLELVDRCRAINLTPGQRAWSRDDLNVHMKRIYGHNNLGLLCRCKTAGRCSLGDGIAII